MQKNHFQDDLAVELWVLYSLGLIFIACRLTARRMLLRSFRKFQLDDYIMMFTTLTFTGVFVSAFQIASNGSNYVYLPPGTVESLNDNERTMAILGSKWALALEEFTLTTLWLVKVCILILYGRLTLGLRQHLAVKALGVYCVVGYLLIQILFFGVWCKPVQQYWALPPTSSTQCATYYHHMIVQSVFNMSSDLMMLLIPLPLLITSRLPMKRKLIVCIVFSLGIFVILAAILNRYYNFTQKYSLIFLNWYVGEVSTAVFVANIPLCWPLFRHIFRLDSFGDSSRSNGPESLSSSTPNGMRNEIRGFATRDRKPGQEMMSSNTRSVFGLGERGDGFWETGLEGGVQDVELGAVGSGVEERSHELGASLGRVDDDSKRSVHVSHSSG